MAPAIVPPQKPCSLLGLQNEKADNISGDVHISGVTNVNLQLGSQ